MSVVDDVYETWRHYAGYLSPSVSIGDYLAKMKTLNPSEVDDLNDRISRMELQELRKLKRLKRSPWLRRNR